MSDQAWEETFLAMGMVLDVTLPGKNHLPGNETFGNIVESQETTSHKSSGHWISRRRISFMKSRHGETRVRATAPRDSIRTLEDIISERSDYSIDSLRQVTD